MPDDESDKSRAARGILAARYQPAEADGPSSSRCLPRRQASQQVLGNREVVVPGVGARLPFAEFGQGLRLEALRIDVGPVHGQDAVRKLGGPLEIPPGQCLPAA